MADDRSSGGGGAPVADPDSGGSTAAFLDALRVKRNGVVGMAAGAAVAVVVFVMFVLLPGETTGSPVLYAGLAVVVAAALGALFAAALTLVTAWRRTREL